LEERRIRLLHRLNIGVPWEAVDLAIRAGTELTRGDYLRLVTAGYCQMDIIEKAHDEALLECLDDSRKKLDVIKKAVDSHRRQQSQQIVAQPILEPYKG